MFCSVIYESIHWSTYVIKWIASIIIPAVYQWVSFLPAAAVAVLLLLELLLLVAVVTVWLRLEEVDEVLEVLELVFEVRPRIVALGGSGWLTWKFHMDKQKKNPLLGETKGPFSSTKTWHSLTTEGNDAMTCPMRVGLCGICMSLIDPDSSAWFYHGKWSQNRWLLHCW